MRAVRDHYNMAIDNFFHSRYPPLMKQTSFMSVFILSLEISYEVTFHIASFLEEVLFLSKLLHASLRLLQQHIY